MFWANRSCVLSDLSNLSDSLICLERSSESLTVTHLIWAKCANERWANERIPSPEQIHSNSASMLNSLQMPRKLCCVYCDWYLVSIWVVIILFVGTLRHIFLILFFSFFFTISLFSHFFLSYFFFSYFFLSFFFWCFILIFFSHFFLLVFLSPFSCRWLGCGGTRSVGDTSYIDNISYQGDTWW